jgi:hypothetical protein
MSNTLYTTAKKLLQKPYLIGCGVGIILGIVISGIAIGSYKLLTNYRLSRIQNAYYSAQFRPEQSKTGKDAQFYQSVSKSSAVNEQQEIQNFNRDKAIQEDSYKTAIKNQELWDTAKKTGNFKDVVFSISNQGGEAPQPGECMYNVDPKHNPAIDLPKFSLKNPVTGEVSGIFRSNFILGLKPGSNGASKGSDTIGFNLEFVCQKYNPKYSFVDSFGPEGFVKVDCGEIMFLSQNFRQKLNPDTCVRMRDNASFWLFRDNKNEIEYDLNLLGAKEIKETLQLEIDLK